MTFLVYLSRYAADRGTCCAGVIYFLGMFSHKASRPLILSLRATEKQPSCVFKGRLFDSVARWGNRSKGSKGK